MLFKDIKQNYPVYVFDKQELKFMEGKVTSISLPRMNMGGQMPMMGQNSANMVVDVTIDAGGRSATYTIPENLSVTYAGNLVLSTERDGISREVEAMKNAAEQVLNSVDRQKDIVEKTTALLVELNPVYKEKRDTEERFNKIESSVSEMKNMLSSFIREFKN
jgi:hypothetical protein